MYFPGARTKAMIYYVSSYVEKKLHLVTGTSDLKSVNSPEEIANETISLVLFVKEKAHQIAVSLIVPRGEIDSPKQLRMLTTVWKLRYFNFEPSFKLRWCRARDLFGSQIPVTTGGFELRISCIQSRYLTHYAIRPNRLGTTLRHD